MKVRRKIERLESEKMVFSKTYSKEDVLGVMNTHKPCTTSFVMKQLDCARDTAAGYLEELAREKKVRKDYVDGGNPVWVKHMDFSSWIQRDARGMTITNGDLLDELGDVILTSGEDVALGYVLDYLISVDYSIQHSLVMLKLDEIEYRDNETVLKCLKPLNRMWGDENGDEVILPDALFEYENGNPVFEGKIVTDDVYRELSGYDENDQYDPKRDISRTFIITVKGAANQKTTRVDIVQEAQLNEFMAQIIAAENEELKQATELAEKIRNCSDMKQCAEFLDELNYHATTMSLFRPRGNMHTIKKAIEFLDFGVEFMKEKMDNDDVDFSVFNSEENDLFNELAQSKVQLEHRIEYLKKAEAKEA